MIDAKTKLFGLLGNPVGHSMSPFMHNIFLQQCGVNGVYLAFAVESGQVGAAMQGMYALGVQGCNVTIPHKEAVIPYLCGMSKAAEACGAVNTLIYTPEGYYGDNTDDYDKTFFYEGLGFTDITIDPHFDINNRKQVNEIIDSSYKYKIIGLPNDSCIVIKDNEIYYINNYFVVEDGKIKEKMY